MKPKHITYKQLTKWTILSVDKNNGPIRMFNWSNPANGPLVTGFQPVINDEYNYGWITYKDILILAKRLAQVAPVDLTLTVNGIVVADLQEKSDVCNKAYIVEYTQRRQYEPYTLKEVEDLEKAQTLKSLISNQLLTAPTNKLSQILKLLETKPTPKPKLVALAQ